MDKQVVESDPKPIAYSVMEPLTVVKLEHAGDWMQVTFEDVAGETLVIDMDWKMGSKLRLGDKVDAMFTRH